MHQSYNSTVKNNKKPNFLNASDGGSPVNYKKWSFRRLFRRKKHTEVHHNDSSTDDDNAGFSPSQKHSHLATASLFTRHNKKQKRVHQPDYHDINGLNVGELIYVNNGETITTRKATITTCRDNDNNELFLPVEIVPQLPSKKYYYYDRHLEFQPQQHMPLRVHNLSKQKSQTPSALHIVEQCSTDLNSIKDLRDSPNYGEVISINSANQLKYFSNENLQAVNNYSNQNRKSRAARNERYFKRLSRENESSHGQDTIHDDNQTTQRWKTQTVSLSVYQPIKQSSVHTVEPYVQWSQLQQRQQPNNRLYNSVNENKRSISYDSQLHLQNTYSKIKQVKTLSPPPPPVPRDPLRRLNLNGSNNQNVSYNDLRPTSYAFDQMDVPIIPSNTRLTERCVSDDKIWAQPHLYCQSMQSLNKSVEMTSQSQRNISFPTKVRRDTNVNDLDYRYVADSAPRSRRPIYMLEKVQDIPSSGVLRTTKSGLPESPMHKIKETQFWKRLDEKVSQKIQESSLSNRGRDINRSVVNDVNKLRSISTSRVLELRTYPKPIYSEVYKPKQHKFLQSTDTSKQHNNEGDNVVCGTLAIKTSDNNKRNSLGSHCKKLSDSDKEVSNDNILNGCKQQLSEGKNCQRNKDRSRLDILQIVVPRKKPTNLEEAINELEAIYHSLGINNENEKAGSTLPSPKDFDQYALHHADEYDDDDSPAGEPDPIKDDVAYRNIKLANLQHKITEKQLPFGIPLRPTVPAANSDYLKIPTEKLNSCCYEHIRTISPDVTTDDLAVRTLRKEPPILSCLKSSFPKCSNDSSSKKDRALRTQSANIYALMRDSSKPSGASDMCYPDFACVRCLDRSGSLSDMTKNNNITNDTPSTLKLLQSLREQENCNKALKAKKLCLPFRHPSQGGAICQLPVILSPPIKETKMKATFLPCTPIKPEGQLIEGPRPSSRMEEALNKIAQDAQKSSIKLSHDLQELRKEALISVPKVNLLVPSKDEDTLEMKLNEIEKVTKAAKQCSEMLLNALPDRLRTSSGDITEILNYTSDCNEDKLIKAIDEVSVAANKVCEKILRDIQHKDVLCMLPKENNVIDNKTQMDNIDEIAKHCLRQLTNISGNQSNYDKKLIGENMSNISASSCNLETIEAKSHKYIKDLSHSNFTESSYGVKTETKEEDSIKRKMQDDTVIDEIDQIIRECEKEILDNIVTLRPAPEGRVSQVIEQSHNNSVPSYICSSSYSETSGEKSSSPSDNRRISSSITSCQPYSSNGYLKTPSSEVQALNSTDGIKTISTTSYDVQSTTSNASNFTTSTASPSPSPAPLNLKNLQEDSINGDIKKKKSTAQNCRRFSSPFQYNSSDELAKIFGHDDSETKLSKNSGNEVTFTSLTELSKILPNTAVECAACSIQSYAITQPAVNELFLPCYPSTTTTTTTKRNVICHEPLNTSDSLFNINTNYYTNQNVAYNYSHKLEIINANKTESLNRQIGQEEIFHKIVASNLNITEDNQKQLHDISNNYPTQKELSLNSYSDEISSNPDSGNVSLADFPLLAASTTNTSSASLYLQTNYNSKYQFIKTYVSEIALGQTVNMNYNKQECENLCENSVEKIERQAQEMDSNRIGSTANGSSLESEATDHEVKEKSHTSINRNHLLFKETNMTYSVKTCNESSPIRRQRKESVIIETPKLQLTIMEEKVNYEINVKPELKQFQFVNDNKNIEKDFNILKEKNGADEAEEKEETYVETLPLNTWPIKQSEKTVKKDYAELRASCTSMNASMNSKTLMNVFGEQRPVVNALTLLEHLVVACTLNSLNRNDLLTLFLVIIGVIIIKILTLR